MTIGQRLRELRIKKKMTAIELSQQMSIDKSTISKWESDNRSPDAETLQKLANFFDVSIDYLIGKTDIRNPEEGYAINHNDVLIGLYGKVKDFTPEEQAEINDQIDLVLALYKQKKEKESK